MPVIRDIPIRVDPEELLTAHRPRGRRVSEARAAGMRDAIEQALARLVQVATPAIVYEIYAVERVDGPTVWLEGGHSLTIGPNADLLAPAERALVAACTIGPELDRAVKAYFASGASMVGLMLDSAGVIALGQVGQRAFALAEQEAGALGGGVSPCLSPGSASQWPISGQRELCGLLPINQIGLALNESNLLVPFKSVSLLIGIGAGYTNYAVGSLCHLCALSDRCWRRR